MAEALHEQGRQKAVAAGSKEYACEGMLSTSYSTSQFFKPDTAAETIPICSSLVQHILRYLMEVLGGDCRFTMLAEKHAPSHFTVCNSPCSSPCSRPLLPLEHTPKENRRFEALQTSSLNQHPVKLQVKGRNTSLPNHKGCNECGFNWLVQELHSQNQQLAMKSALLHCRLLNFCPCLQCGVSRKQFSTHKKSYRSI